MSWQARGGGSSNGLLPTILALIAAFMATSELYALSIDWVRAYTVINYGAGWLMLVPLVWFVICACLAFALARLAVSLILGLIAMAVAEWF